MFMFQFLAKSLINEDPDQKQQREKGFFFLLKLQWEAVKYQSWVKVVSFTADNMDAIRKKMNNLKVLSIIIIMYAFSSVPRVRLLTSTARQTC